MNFKKFISILLLFTLSVNLVCAADGLERIPAKMLLQRLDNYVVDITMYDDNNVHVVQSFEIVSRHKEPIIPGRAKVILYNSINPKNVRVNIGGSYRDIADQDIIEEDGNQVIYYEIWRPITPGERLNIQIEFDTLIETEGFLFKQLDMKFGEPELPIDKIVFSINLPAGKTITYSEPQLTQKGSGTGVIEFEANGANEATLSLEYSALPLPTLPFNGYWLWLIIVLMSVALFLVKLVNRDKFSVPPTPFS